MMCRVNIQRLVNNVDNGPSDVLYMSDINMYILLHLIIVILIYLLIIIIVKC